MKDRTWGDLPVPNIYKELKGEFVDFSQKEEKLICKFPVQDKYFNPMDTTLGGIIDSWMDCVMGPLSFLIGEMVVTKEFKSKYIRPVNSSTSFVKSIAWRDSVTTKGSIYKAELYLDTGEIAATAEAIFVQPKNYESLFENM
jgi:acyl-coenzyme A thioesterase PaaI-like protein|tara:strand:+ start:2335 stop:2760 length:426 start_codon:yes stop_codon:yes gene_type:complete